MKKYIKPVIENYDLYTEGTIADNTIIIVSANKATADQNYSGGGDAKRTTFTEDWDDEEEDSLEFSL